jgi:hypothetical protein
MPHPTNELIRVPYEYFSKDSTNKFCQLFFDVIQTIFVRIRSSVASRSNPFVQVLLASTCFATATSNDAFGSFVEEGYFFLVKVKFL